MLGLYFILFSLSIDFAYVFYVYPVFSYSGLELDVSYWNMTLKLVFFSIIALFIRAYKNSDRAFLAYILFLIMVPLGAIYAVGGGDEKFFYLSLVFFFIVALVVKFNVVVFSRIPVARGIWLIVLLVITFFLLYFFLLKAPVVLSLVDFNIDQAGLRRLVFSSYYNKFDSYALVWLFSAVLPFLLWRSLVLGNKRLVLLFFILSSVSMLFTFRKEFYLITAFVFMVFIYKKYAVKMFFLGGAVLVIFIIVIYGDQYAIRYFINRQFVSVGANQYMYYDMANKNDFVFFSNSFLKYFIDYPYEDSVAKIIGALRYESEYENSSNAGVLGSAYIQGGWSVVIIYAFIVGGVYNQYKYFDRIAGIDSVSIFSLIFVYKLTNNDLLTTLLTGGVLIFFILLVASYELGRKIKSLRCL